MSSKRATKKFLSRFLEADSQLVVFDRVSFGVIV